MKDFCLVKILAMVSIVTEVNVLFLQTFSASNKVSK